MDPMNDFANELFLISIWALALTSFLSTFDVLSDFAQAQLPRSVIRIKKKFQTSDYNPALIPYFGYLKMEKSKFFNTGFFSNCDFKVSTLYS